MFRYLAVRMKMMMMMMVMMMTMWKMWFCCRGRCAFYLAVRSQKQNGSRTRQLHFL